VHTSGAEIFVTYETEESIIDDLDIIQVIWTNYPIQGQSSPYMDHQENAFYYYSYEQETTFHDLESYTLYDLPMRPYSGTNTVEWNAATFFVTTYEEQVTIYDGLYWGWYSLGNELRPSLQGSFGTEINNAPVPEPGTVAGLALGCILIRRLKRR
jgi:hypothetical protein